MGIEKCPNCNLKVLFTNDICPSCKSKKTIPVQTANSKNEVAPQTGVLKQNNSITEARPTSRFEDLKATALKEGYVTINKKEFQNNDLNKLEKAVDILLEKADADGTERINISASGYENDSRALFTIPEIREWSSTMGAKSGSLGYLDEETLSWCIPAISPIEVVNADKRTTQFIWDAKKCIRVYYMMAFYSLMKVQQDHALLHTTMKEMSSRFQAVALRFGTVFELDNQLLAEIKAIRNPTRSQQ